MIEKTYRVICCRMRYRTDMSLSESISQLSEKHRAGQEVLQRGYWSSVRYGATKVCGGSHVKQAQPPTHTIPRVTKTLPCPSFSLLFSRLTDAELEDYPGKLYLPNSRNEPVIVGRETCGSHVKQEKTANHAPCSESCGWATFPNRKGLGSEIAARNCKSLVISHRALRFRERPPG